MQQPIDCERKQAERVHFHPIFACSGPMRRAGRLEKLLQRLTALMFHWHRLDYPGRNKALAEALGYSVSTIEHGHKGRLSPPMAFRAEKFCRKMALELIGLADEFKAEGEKLTLAKQGRSRGMFDVRVRDKTGIPRSAVWPKLPPDVRAKFPNPGRAGGGKKSRTKPNPF